jgi:competence protein ComEC
MNVSILAFVVFWTLRRLRVGDVPATLLTVASCAGYAFITEVGAPVWRATLRCAVYLGTRLLYRDRAMTNAVGAAAFGLLVFDPRQLFTASFQMTFLCVLIVAAIGMPMLERSSQLYRQALANWDSKDYAVLLPPRVAQFRLDLQMISARLALFVGDTWAARSIRGAVRVSFAIWDLLLISAVMQAGPRATHGLLLPSRDDDRLAREPGRCAADSMDDAGRRARAWAGIRIPVAG